MSFNMFCSVALALSMATIGFAIFLGIKSYRFEYRENGEALYRQHFVLTPFQIFLIGFFVGTAFIFLPIYYTDYFAGEMQLVRILKSIFLSIHNTIRLFIVDGEFDIIENAVADHARVHHVIGNAYSVYASILFVAAPVLTAGFILSFFKSISANIKYMLSASTEIYYISELNEKSIALATNILSESEAEKPLIVFFDVFESQEKMNCDLIDQAKRLGAVCFRKDITEIGLKPLRKRAKRKFYFLGEDEDKNVKQALALIKRCRESSCYNVSNTELYVFSTTADSEVLLDSVDNGDMKVRRINGVRNLVINTLLNEPIFENFTEENEEKKVTVLIVGGGKYGEELMKAISWCGQIPGYVVSIHVVDKTNELKSRLYNAAPEFMSKNKRREVGEPYYEINIHSNVDVYGSKFHKLLSDIGEVNTAFITLGSDEINVDMAMRLRKEYGRLHLKKNFSIPEIYSVVYSTLKTQTFLENGGLLCLGKDSYGIKFIGDIRTRYSLGVIEQLELEKDGLKIHVQWLKSKKAQIQEENKDEEEINRKIKEEEHYYYKYEYFRRASISAAVYMKVLSNLGVSFASKEEGKEVEHKRWNAYMRSEGYIYDPNPKDHIAKTHHDLVPYQKLKPEIQVKDEITVTVMKECANSES